MSIAETPHLAQIIELERLKHFLKKMLSR